MENIGVRAVIEGLSGYMSGLKDMQQATTDQTKALGDLQKAGVDASKTVTGMSSPMASVTGVLDKFQAGTSDEARELASMSGAIEKTKTPMAQFKGTLDGIIDSVAKNKLAIAAFGATIVGSMGLMVKAAEEQRLSQAKLSVALQNVGVSYAEVSKQLEATMAATAKKTGISDEAQRNALSQLVFITGSYERSLAALPVALDLAAAKGMDASSAAMILGRAMSGSTEMLKRYGIYVEKGASATEILAQVQRTVAGSAEAMASPFAIMKDQMGELGETIGTILLPPLKLFTTTVVWVVNVIREFIEHTGILGKSLIYITGIVGLGALALVAYTMALKSGIIQETIAIARKVGHAIAQVALNIAVAAGINPALGFAAAVNAAIWPLTLIVGIIAAVIAAIVLLIKHWNDIMDLFGLTSNEAKKAAESIDGFKKSIADLTVKLADQNVDLGKLNTELKTLQDKYAYVTDNAAGYRDEIKKLNDAIASQESRIESLNDKIGETTSQIKELEDATSAAYEELNRLSTPRLAGMQEYEDQIFTVDQELKKLQLRELKEGESPALTARIEALEKQKKELELTRDIKFDPLTRSAKEAVETLTGMNEEMSSGAAMSRIAQLGSQITTNNAELVVLHKTLTGYTSTMAILKSGLVSLQGQLSRIMTIVNGELATLSEQILNVKNSIYLLGLAITDTQAAIENKAASMASAENPNPTTTPTGISHPESYTQGSWLRTLSLPNIFDYLTGRTPHAQYGGEIRVGERGPEVVQLPVGSTVYPNNYNTTYNVNANYSRQQDPQSIGMDLEAIRMMSRA